MSEQSRFSRNELLFGREGQAKIAATTVAIVGLGGLGSHIAQQLAYLGTEEFVLIDADRVTVSNLNRMIGATLDDVAAATPKVLVARRQVQTIRPDARVRSFDAWIVDAEARAAAGSCNVLFGCLDEDPPRLRLVELSSTNKLAYFDLATDVSEEAGSTAGGSLRQSTASDACPACRCWIRRLCAR